MRNLKKVVALIAVFAMMVSTVAFAQSFTDVSENHDAYEAIEMLSNLGILTGDDQDGDGKMDFRPEDPITRAEVAAVMSRIQGINNVGQTSTQFTDVAQSHWASGYVAQAAGQGIVNGYGDGNFGPEDNILVEQAIKMVMVTIGYEPFAADNGGYPTGYQTAAQRYGVLKDVSVDAKAEATRAVIAQLVYNAIDTPLMDRYTYGADAEYVIYNGKGDYEFETLLTRDLGVKKFTTVLTGNTVTTTTDAFDTIDTEDPEEIAFDFATIDTDDQWYNYDLDEITTVYANGTDAAAYIGQQVEVYVKEAAKKGEYDIISIAATNKNKTTTIPLAAYMGYNETDEVIEYLKNETDSRNTTIKVEDDAVVFLNGVYFGTVAGLDSSDLKNETLVGSAYSGEVTVLDNGIGTKANYVFFNIGTVAVVDEVSASGKVTFKADPTTIDGNTIAKLHFDEENYNQIIDLTKDGVAVEYTELKEWDVLSILANDLNEYYVVSVIEAGKIEGSISQRAASTTSAEGYEYTINGTAYDVANGAYECDNLKPGSTGIFYIDNYGKIVAYDKTGSAVASDNYAYVLNTAKTSDDWENDNLKVQILAKDGKVYEAFLAEKVTIEYPGTVGLTSTELGDKFDAESAAYDIKDIDMEALKAALKNQVITYAANSAGEFKTITFAQTDEDVSSLHFTKDAEDVEFDGEDFVLKFGSKKYDVAEDAVVFFITNSATSDAEKVYYDGSVSGDASKTMSKVVTAAALSDGEEYDYGQLFDSQDDIANVIVLYNTTGGISSSSNIAVIDKVGTAVYNGEVVDAVTYYMGGVLYTSYTDVDYSGDLASAEQGDIYKLAVSTDGTVITESVKYYDYDRYMVDTNDSPEVEDWEFLPAAGEAGALTSVSLANSKEALVSALPIEYVSSRKTFRVANDTSYETYDSIKLADGVNVYVLDPNKAKNKLTIGAAGDVEIDKEVLKHAQGIIDETYDGETDTVDNANVNDLVFEDATVDNLEAALGAMDYIVAFSYDEDVIDVVIYKAYDFGKIQ